MPLSFKMKIRISLHLNLRNTELVRYKLYTMLKFLNLFSCWVFLLGSWCLVNWTISAWCQDVKLSLFWANHYKLHHSDLFTLWESKFCCHFSKCWASFTHPLAPMHILKHEKSFRFCGGACWLLAVTTGLILSWRNYWKIIWNLFPIKNTEFFYNAGHREL